MGSLSGVPPSSRWPAPLFAAAVVRYGVGVAGGVGT